MNVKLAGAVLLLVGLAAAGWAVQDVSKEQIRTGLKDTELQGAWIYDDLPAGIAEASKSGKPLMIVFRCVPCVTFKQLDKQVAAREDAELAKVMDKFVCVRVVQAWGMDLSQFQFDNDLNWAVFFMNADKTIYGRYGTKCAGKDPVRYSSVAGLRRALEGALELHSAYPGNKKDFAEKTGKPAAWKAPEEIPDIQKRPNAKPADGTRKNCIHCHMIHEAEAWSIRAGGKPVPDRVLWPYPLPDELGLSLDPEERAKVTAVAAGSVAEKGGFKAGDRIAKLEGQPILSIADVQWVLHNAAEPSTLKAEIDRGGQKAAATLEIAAGWRQKGDLAWRTLVWSMRHKLLGTEPLEALTAEERSKAGVAEGAMALRIKNMPPAFVKEKNADAAGKLQKGDVIVEVDGRKDLTESGVLALLMNKKAGSSVNLTFLRGGQSQKVTLSIP